MSSKIEWGQVILFVLLVGTVLTTAIKVYGELLFLLFTHPLGQLLVVAAAVFWFIGWAMSNYTFK